MYKVVTWNKFADTKYFIINDNTNQIVAECSDEFFAAGLVIKINKETKN